MHFTSLLRAISVSGGQR